MKRQIFVFTVFLLTLQYTYSQNPGPANVPGDRNAGTGKTVLSFSLGPSIPVGGFSSTDPAGKYSGYAELGETVNFFLVHKLNDHFGLVAMFYGQRNTVNTGVVAQQFSETGWFGYNGFGPRYYPNWSVDKKSWYLESLLLGVTREFPVKSNRKFSFTAKALLGLAYVQSPKLNASSKTDTSFTEIMQTSASAFGLSYLASAGIKYKWTQKFYLLFNVDYFGTSHINFKNVNEILATTNGGLVFPHLYAISNSALPPAYNEGTGTTKQPVGSINVNFGIGMKL